MSLNSDEERESLKRSFSNTEDIRGTITSLEYIYEYQTPFALYVATLDNTNFMWIFDPDTVYRMIGGERAYQGVFDSLFLSEEEREVGIIFFVLRKVGPLVSVRVDKATIGDIIQELYDEL